MPIHRSHAFAALLALAAASCSSPAPVLEPLPTVLEVAHAAGAKLGGAALGDVMPEHPGLEIVTVCVDGRVIVIWREKGRWRSEVAFQAPGELIQVAVGDLIASHPGDEILAVGMAEGDEDSGGPGAVWLGTRHRDRGWEGRRILVPDALQHAAVIADLDPTHDGLEGLTSGFDMRLHLFRIDVDEDAVVHVTHTDAGALPGPAKGACALREGDGALIACSTGELVQTAWSDQGLRPSVLLKHESGLARPAAWSDFGPSGAHTYSVATASDSGELLRSNLYVGQWKAPTLVIGVVHVEPSKLRGAAFVALEDGGAAQHVATSGYEGRISLIALDATEPGSAIVLADTGQALHHLVSGDVRPDLPGDELVAVGYAGEVYVLSR
jgi:hypothetical protein